MNAALRVSQLLLCVGLAAGAVCASAGVNRCVSDDGRVLLTDADCPQGSRPSVSDDGAAGIAINSGSAAPRAVDDLERVRAEVTAALAPLPRSAWADLPHPLVRKSASLDAGTLLAAYQTMQMQDEIRSQRHLLSLR
ncbi:hypothetical protein D0T25_26670 [Duganella sp. BJB488]|uniref:hypothetical protein n=1 Tax=unclassified Duganella TaxID=2636909 RepID=UPI000E3518FD|nr:MULTISPECIES: hypothetical protein [unclassified Duganella]RFP11117.1 hypothetical protein D0T26_26625 [Duganella sp. BJB489]RFP14371.1 hypothetical protein D0T25_26670 [Duganella sp. BJB488]RFP30306.1 hypothetical protein D0T24_27370 [Duganella sp. BJB480]